MAGNFTVKLLANGVVPAVKTTIYTVPALTSTIIKAITLVNQDVACEHVVNLYIKASGGTSREIIPYNTQLGARYLLETDSVYTLNAGDTIEAYADLASVIAYTVNGIEEV